MKSSNVHRLWVSLVLAFLFGLLCAPAGAATTKAKLIKATTLQLFQQRVKNQVLNGRGHVVTSHIKLASGYKVTATYREFIGDHVQHHARSTGTGTMTCYYTSSVNALCTARVSVGGSSILATRVPVDFSIEPVLIAVNGGTGTYDKVHGLITATSVGSSGNADLTIIVAPRLNAPTHA